MSETFLRTLLKIIAVGAAAGLASGFTCGWTLAPLIAAAAMAPLGADWAWTAFQTPAPEVKTAPPPAADTPPSPVLASPEPVATPNAAVQPSMDDNAWNTHLPDLVSVFEGLSQNIIVDITRASERFITQLGTIEHQILATNALHATTLDDLGEIDKKAQDHLQDRDELDRSIVDAMSFGDQIHKEIAETRTTLRGVVDNVQDLEKEVSQIGRVAKSVNMLALNAGIEAARAGEAGAGFTIIARDIRALAAETQALTDRLTPLIEDIQTTVVDYSSQRETTGKKDDGIRARLARQADVLTRVKERLYKVSSQHERLIDSQRKAISGSHASGIEIEKAIRISLTTAQFGDILRQQLETIINGMSDLRAIAATQRDDAIVRQKLLEVLEKMSDLYVMSAQRKAHADSVGASTAPGAPLPTPDDEPAMEMF